MTISVKIVSRGFLAAAMFAVLADEPARAQSADTSFFLTSTGIGNGGNLGGLAGADNHCQTLAQAAGAGAKTWHAYLSTQAADGKPAVNARDRIGKGPWRNSKAVVIAKDVTELHGANNLTKQTALSEKGDVINGRGDTPNRHDVLTGSQPDGAAFPAGDDRTCKNWTSSTQGSAWWVIPTASACATMMRRNPGTVRILRAGRMAAARRPTSRAPAATACCIVSRRTKGSPARCIFRNPIAPLRRSYAASRNEAAHAL